MQGRSVGGAADLETGSAWQRDTVVSVYSTSKTMVNPTAHRRANREQLDFNAPVIRYWPEFGAGGREGVEARPLLGHTSGLSGWEVRLTEQNLAR